MNSIWSYLRWSRVNSTRPGTQCEPPAGSGGASKVRHVQEVNLNSGCCSFGKTLYSTNTSSSESHPVVS